MPLIEEDDPVETNGERLAVNLWDLDRVEPLIRQMLLSGNVDLTQAIRTDPSRLDEGAVAFICPLLQAASICDVLRAHDRQAGDHPTRVYVFKKTWSKVAGHVALTKVVGGKAKLNPEVFAVAPIVVPTPPKPKRVIAGRRLGGR